MEPNTTPVTAEPITSTQTVPPAPTSFKPKAPPKLLYLVAGLAVILVSLALGIVFFGKTKSPTTTKSTSSIGAEIVVDESWPKYTNVDYFYEISLPKEWPEIKRSPLITDTTLFNVENLATLEITAQKSTQTLDQFLASQDESHKDLVKSKGSTQIKVGAYDGYERAESWPTTGLQVTTSYVQVSDMLYIFTLIPASGKSALTNDTIIRQYHAILASFRLTDTTKLGVDLKDYTSTKADGLPFKSFSLKYPRSWVVTEKLGEKSLDISIYRNNYELTISQKPIGTSVCLFSDSPAFEGSSGDLRNKQFAEFTTISGATLRRYFNANAGDKSSMFFCEKQIDGPYFQTPLTIGGLVYSVPAKYDTDIIKEMDEIVKSIVPEP